MTDGAAGCEGRRRKTSKGGNREKGRCGGCRVRYGDLIAAEKACELRQGDRAD